MDKLIATFLAVYETRNFSLAAKQLFISQPSVSIQINQLEKKLQVKLFDRNGRRQIVPTQAADRFYRYSQETLDEWQIMVDELRSLTQNPVWSAPLGVSQTASVELLPQMMPQLLTHHEYEFSIHTMNSEAILAGVLDHSLSYGIIEKPMVANGVVETKLPGDQLVLAGNLTDDLWLVREPGSGVRHYTEAYFREMKQQPTQTMTVNSNQTIIGLLQTGVGKTIIAASLVPENVAVKALGSAFERSFYLVGLAQQSNLALRKLRELLEKTALKKG